MAERGWIDCDVTVQFDAIVGLDNGRTRFDLLHTQVYE